MIRRSAIVLAAAVIVAAVAAGVIGPTLGAHSTARAASVPPVVAGSDYLALGDSVSFGYREPTTSPAPDYKRPGSFVGFPEIVAADLGLHVANLACSGETAASLINDKAPSNGCESHVANSKVVPGGYRTVYPLHVKYKGSQLAAGVAYLKSHPDTRLVTLMIGANDFFLCEETTKDGCESRSEQAAVLSRIAKNTETILTAVRKTGYEGQIVLVGYYSLDYEVALDNELSEALDEVMQEVAPAFHAEYANGYAAFMAASRYSGGDPCRAGLLTQLYSKGKPTGTCGIHPAPPGASVLASVVDETVIK